MTLLCKTFLSASLCFCSCAGASLTCSRPSPAAPPAVFVPAVPHAAPPACAPYEADNGPLLIGDPLLQRPGYPTPGWFGSAEIDIVGPSLRNRLVNTVDVAGLFTDVVHL